MTMLRIPCCVLQGERVSTAFQDAEPVVTDTYTILQKDSNCDNLAAPAPYLPTAGGLAPAPSASSGSSIAG